MPSGADKALLHMAKLTFVVVLSMHYDKLNTYIMQSCNSLWEFAFLKHPAFNLNIMNPGPDVEIIRCFEFY